MKHIELISSLQSKLVDVLDPYIKPGMRVALIDFPHHANAGDSYIWFGQIEYLLRRGANIVYVCWNGAYDPDCIKHVLGPQGVVLFHGGGNFGDRWSEPHALRLRVLNDLKGHRVIQFPQTVRFDHAENIVATQAAVAEHGDFVLFVRDQASYDFSTAHFGCPVELSPDMAFFIGARKPVSVLRDGIVLARTDIESAGPKAVAHLDLTMLPGVWLRDDWLVPDWAEAKLTNFLCRFNRRWNRNALGRALMVILANRLASQRLKRGIRQLSSGRLVVTDRLHAHILCLLLGKRHMVMDNDYGKISTFHQAWTRSAEDAKFVRVLNDIPQQLRAMADAT
ncbi:exopolysaccharide biosynthesis protein [Jeongeupia sp. HS-3]|uniref:polysaccharide pyruvyl transferase family protein n=1 Tax=Jeongeupia sp. HS-3 TaxID=1009682 RepID=UPI0018A510F8|nr:polysaccharide pyruvyl transferase family protein [Jeongeupia sp. HS-3]BCL74675.1 exopolysaccharide biosynthesis protein [Jeongeupia sp. HS-3]